MTGSFIDPAHEARKAKYQELNELLEKGAGIATEMQEQYGVGVGMAEVIQDRLEFFIDAILPSDLDAEGIPKNDARLDFEIAFQRDLNDKSERTLAQVKAQAEEAKKPKLHVAKGIPTAPVGTREQRRHGG